MSRTTKIRNLGKQHKPLLCSQKTKISTNYPASLVLTKFFLELPKSKRRTQRTQDSVTLFTETFKIVFQVTQALFK